MKQKNEIFSISKTIMIKTDSVPFQIPVIKAQISITLNFICGTKEFAPDSSSRGLFWILFSTGKKVSARCLPERSRRSGRRRACLIIRCEILDCSRGHKGLLVESSCWKDI